MSDATLTPPSETERRWLAPLPPGDRGGALSLSSSSRHRRRPVARAPHAARDRGWPSGSTARRRPTPSAISSRASPRAGLRRVPDATITPSGSRTTVRAQPVRVSARRGLFLSDTFRAEGSSYEFSLPRRAPNTAAGWSMRRGRAPPSSSGRWRSPPTAASRSRPSGARRRRGVARPVTPSELIGHQKALRASPWRCPMAARSAWRACREFAAAAAVGESPTAALKNQENGSVIRANPVSGFSETEAGEKLQPGFQVGIGWDNYRRIFTEARFRGRSCASSSGRCCSRADRAVLLPLGMLLAVLLNWDARCASAATARCCSCPMRCRVSSPSWCSGSVQPERRRDQPHPLVAVRHQAAWFSDPCWPR